MLERAAADEAELATLQDDLEGITRLVGRQHELRTGLESNVGTLRTLFTQNLPPEDNPFLWATERVYRYAREHHVAVESITELRQAVPAWVAASTAAPAGGDDDDAEARRRPVPRAPPGAAPRKPEPPPADEGRHFSPYTVQVKLRCAYPDLLALVAAIERDNPYASVSSLSVVADESSPEQQSVLRLSIEWPRHVGPLDKAIRDAVLAQEGTP
jgi:hypothetical protein